MDPTIALEYVKGAVARGEGIEGAVAEKIRKIPLAQLGDIAEVIEDLGLSEAAPEQRLGVLLAQGLDRFYADGGTASHMEVTKGVLVKALVRQLANGYREFYASLGLTQRARELTEDEVRVAGLDYFMSFSTDDEHAAREGREVSFGKAIRDDPYAGELPHGFEGYNIGGGPKK
ncbi:hypothetical protein ACFL0V_03070 [Nanoarchaeota archaeon]